MKITRRAYRWHTPVPAAYFVVSQPYLQEDWALYPKFGHHIGVDYGGHGRTGIPIIACAAGVIVYRDTEDSPWGKTLGNHIALYVPSVDRSFLYCHLEEHPRAFTYVRQGVRLGTMGNTGASVGGAIHLHLEGFYGRFAIAMRSFTSFDDIISKTFDADSFLRAMI
ncbi:MAG: M23 family metallopeptidase [Patescibacteria group bacterium]|nr:M23 family metallopeptidase [Patescibacteria group bacterium]MDE2438623.1 M23 family metallopeptidase [Patescibacteria group bacterium]